MYHYVMTAYERVTNEYVLDIDEAYVKNLNEYLARKVYYVNPDFTPYTITVEDIVAVCKGEEPEHLNVTFQWAWHENQEQPYTESYHDFIYDCVNEDVWGGYSECVDSETWASESEVREW